MRSLVSLALPVVLLSACAAETTDPRPLAAGHAGQSGAAGDGGVGGSSGSSGQSGGTAGAPIAGSSGLGGAAAQGGAGQAGASPAGGQAGAGGAAGGETGAGGGGASGSGPAGSGGEAGAGAAGGAVCGDGEKTGGEACDGAELGDATCVSLHAGGLPRGPDGAPLSLGGPGQLGCTTDCSFDTARCDPPVRAIGSLGTAPEGGGLAYFSEVFTWDAAAKVYRSSTAQRQVQIPSGVMSPDGLTLLAFEAPADPWTLPPSAAPPSYPYLRIDTPEEAAPLYDPCWDHACESALPPRAARPQRQAPLMLRQTGADAYVPGTGKPWVAGKGKLRLVVAVAYATEPMPEASLAQLLAPEGAADSTSLAALPPWFAARSQQLALPSPVEVEIVWSKVQVKVPDAQVPTSYDACVNADWKPLLAPSVALAPGDVLVQIYWGAEGSTCASHVLRSSRSFVLFAQPSFFALPGLVVSGAHELMHLLGASDKYTDSVIQDAQGTYRGCWYEDGPLYQAHDIMCHRVAQLGPDGTFGGFDNPPLHQLTVSPLTAREVGWEDLDGDGTIEIEDACPWDEGC